MKAKELYDRLLRQGLTEEAAILKEKTDYFTKTTIMVWDSDNRIYKTRLVDWLMDLCKWENARKGGFHVYFDIDQEEGR